MLTAAERKALMAKFADDAPLVIFATGEGDGYLMLPIVGEVDGQRIVHVVPVPPAGASPELLEAYSARATATVTGRCPLCDVVAKGTSPDDEMLHEDQCPVTTEALRAALTAHWATGRNAPCPCGSGRKFKWCHWAARP